MKGLTVNIYKYNGQSCDGSIAPFSSKFERLIVLPSEDYPEIPEIFEVSDDCPAVKLFKRNLFGSQKEEYTIAYPVDGDGNVVDRSGYMFGGSYICTSDSRFPMGFPVKLMDRREWA